MGSSISHVIPPHPNKDPLRVAVLELHCTDEEVKVKSRVKKLVQGHSWPGVWPDEARAPLGCFWKRCPLPRQTQLIGFANRGDIELHLPCQLNPPMTHTEQKDTT